MFYINLLFYLFAWFQIMSGDSTPLTWACLLLNGLAMWISDEHKTWGQNK